MSTNYTFSMDSDDGAQLYIDGKLLIDKGGALPMLPHLIPTETLLNMPDGAQRFSRRAPYPQIRAMSTAAVQSRSCIYSNPQHQLHVW